MSDIFDAYEADQFKAIKHNDTDFEQFKDFQKKLLERNENSSKEQLRETLLRRLRDWDDSTRRGRWHGATLKRLDSPVAEQIQRILESHEMSQSFYIQSTDAFHGTYVAYAIVRRYIGAGRAMPSRVIHISEDEILGYANGGFSGRDAFAKLIRKKNNVYVIDNCGARSEYTENREIPMLEELLGDIYKNNKIAIMVGQRSLGGYSEIFSPVGQSVLDGLFKNTVITLQDGQDDTPDTQSGPPNLGLFDG